MSLLRTALGRWSGSLGLVLFFPPLLTYEFLRFCLCLEFLTNSGFVDRFFDYEVSGRRCSYGYPVNASGQALFDDSHCSSSSLFLCDSDAVNVSEGVCRFQYDGIFGLACYCEPAERLRVLVERVADFLAVERLAVYRVNEGLLCSFVSFVVDVV